jgi:Fic family protein
MATRLAAATHALGELAGITRNLPNPHLLIRPFIKREAVLSSRIEGTQASLSDLVLFEAAPRTPPPGRAPPADVQEVANYVVALNYGLKRLHTLPLSLRFIREVHERLMRGVRGDEMRPGEFRTVQNWIGPDGCTADEATYVPPPVPQMREALAQFEHFLHAKSDVPPPIRLAMLHYQFEAIHPFLDGNGRVGRLLMSILLCYEQLLPQPLLYLSAYFERHRAKYYDLLSSVSKNGAWPEWIDFVLTGVEEQSRDATWRIGELLTLWDTYRDRLATARSSGLLLKLLDALFENPAITLPQAAKLLQVTHRSAALNVEKLVKAGVLREITKRSRNKLFVAREVLRKLEVARSP